MASAVMAHAANIPAVECGRLNPFSGDLGDDFRRPVLSFRCRPGSSICEGCWNQPASTVLNSQQWRVSANMTSLRSTWIGNPEPLTRARLFTRRGLNARPVHASIGFTSDRRVSVERAANMLVRDAFSLLVYQEVLRAPPAQAFLRLVLILRRVDDGTKILEAYGEFFRLMAGEKQASWEDYILDRILAGEKNAFADAAARADLEAPRGRDISKAPVVPASLRAAAASDLDSLQRLCITESTLSGWVADVVSDLRPEWRTATAGNLGSQPKERAERERRQDPESRGGDEVERGPFGFVRPSVSIDNQSPNRSAQDEAQLSRPLGFDFGDEPAQPIKALNRGTASSAPATAPLSTLLAAAPSSAERDTWREQIGGLWKWSEAVPLLERYYRERGTGAIAFNTELMWVDGKIVEAASQVAEGACQLSIHEGARKSLQANLERHVAGLPSPHMLLFGDYGMGKTWLLNSVLRKVAQTTGLRVVTLLRADLLTLGVLLEKLGKYPHLRFVVVINDLVFQAGNDMGLLSLKSNLEGAAQPWPKNTLLAATTLRVGFLRVDMMTFGDWSLLEGYETGLHFGLSFPFRALDRDGFIKIAQEIARASGKHVPLEEDEREEWEERADEWFAERCEFLEASIRTVLGARQFVDTLIV